MAIVQASPRIGPVAAVASPRGAAPVSPRATAPDVYHPVASPERALALTAHVNVATLAALAPSGLSAATHRTAMAIIRNMG